MSSLIPADDDPEDTGELLFYQTEDGQNRIQLRLHDGTVWLTQKQLSDLYQVSIPTVNEHLATIYEDGELTPEATIRKFRIVQTEGNRQVSRLVDHYRLEEILSVGFRVRSQRGVQFRRWTMSQLQELLVKGFVMADWRRKLDAFLQFNEREILQNAGIVSMEVAKRLAEAEYDKFHARRLTEEANAEPVEDIDGLRKRLGPNKENQEKDEEGNR
jgi:hypothetical protein